MLGLLTFYIRFGIIFIQSWGETMFKYQIRLETGTDIKEFVEAAEQLSFDIFVENENGMKRGNAKTLLNVVDAMTYNKIYVISDHDMFLPFRKFIMEES